MIGKGSLAHNRREFFAENVDPDRVQLNICYQNENLKEVYKELFDDAVERYNTGKRKDRKITNYYEKIRQGKQEKLFHEVIFQIGNREDMAVGTEAGNLAVNVLDEYVKDFQKRNPTLRVFSCYLHQDEATPHLHIDFIPYVTGWKGKGMDTRVSLKQALKGLGFQGGNKHDTELNQWINHEKEVLAEIAKQHGIEWEQKGTHEEHLDVYNFKKKERKKEVQELEQEKENLTAENPDDATVPEDTKGGRLLGKKKETGEVDDDGYLITKIPWSLSFNYSMSLGYGDFDPNRLEYKYRITHNLSFNGNIQPTKNWSFNFNATYDVENKKISFMTCNVTRNLHCFQMSASFVPVGPYKSYTFSVAVSSSLLKDLKYNQSSGSRSGMDWY